MAHFVIIEDIFDRSTHRSFLHQSAKTPLAWLKERFAGFKEFTHPTVCFVNDEPLFRAEWETRRLKDSDVVTFSPAVGDPISIIIAVVAVVAVAVVVTALIPTPQQPGQIPEPDSVYKLQGQYNQFKLGEPIEVCYGRVRRWPSYAASQYNKYLNNEQLLFALFCIGQGEFEVEEALIEDTNVTSFADTGFNIIEPYQNPAGIFENNVVTSSEVSNVEIFGPNEDEWEGPDGWFPSTGGIVLNPAGTLCNKIEHDIVLPQGLYFANDDGGLNNQKINYQIEYQSISDDLVPVPLSDWVNPDTFMRVERYMRRITESKLGVSPSAWIPYSSFELSQTRSNYSSSQSQRLQGNGTETYRPPWETVTYEFPDYGQSGNSVFDSQFSIRDAQWIIPDGAGQPGDVIRTEGGPKVAGFYTQLEVKRYGAGFSSIKDRTTTPIRFTRTEIMPDEGRWQVRYRRRNDASDSHRVGDTLTIEAVRSFLPSTTNFGDVTLAALQARASNNLNDNSQQRFNLWATRKLQTWDSETGWSADPVATRSIVWAFCDVYRADYGARFGDIYLDLNHLKTLDDFYTARGDFFDYVFDRKMTVLEAARTIARAGRGIPMIRNNKWTIVRDGPATLPTMQFGPHNIIKDSFSWEVSFTEDTDNDAIEMVYTDGDTFKEESVICTLADDPAEPVDPKRITLHGVTNRDKAYREGLYMRANERHIREKVTFKTGLEGRLPDWGDFIAVSHDMPQWGESGHVKSINGTTVKLKDPVTFIDGETHQLSITTKTGALIGPYTVTEGSSPREIILPAPIDTSDLLLDGSGTPPLFLFGISNDFYRQMKISRIANGGQNTVQITCVNYSPIPHTFDGVTAPPISATSTELVVPDIPALGPITVEALPNTLQQVIVKWQPALGASKYVIEFSGNGQTWVPVTEVTTNFYTAQVTPGEVWVRVAAVGQGQSDWQTWTGTVGVLPGAVTFDPAGSDFPSDHYPLSVAISSETLGAVIRWSTSAMPESVTGGSEYVGPVSVNAGDTLYARAFIGTLLAGDGAQQTYTSFTERDTIDGQERDTIEGDIRNII